MPFAEIPLWVAIGTVFVLAHAGLLVLLMLWDLRRLRPRRVVTLPNMSIELWVRERKFPTGAGAIIVPVAPDLRMVAGIAKWVRDATANRVQYEALKAAPLAPGQAFVGSGGIYRFRIAALAVVMDDYKRTTPEWIARGVSHAIRLAREQDVDSVMLPDMTDDLVRQPQSISVEERRATCESVACAMLDGIMDAAGTVETVRIWVHRTELADIYEKALSELEERDMATSQKAVA
jgi:O-acetyl-ADP-ribose deacetylase (regulator of RNase III)